MHYVLCRIYGKWNDKNNDDDDDAGGSSGGGVCAIISKTGFFGHSTFVLQTIDIRLTISLVI